VRTHTHIHLSPRTGAKWVLVWRKPDVSIDHVVFKRVKKHINSKFMYKLNKVCTWSSRIDRFESLHVLCSQKHKHTHTLLSFSWEWVLNIIHNRTRRSKFNQAHKQWLTHTHTRLLSFMHSMYYSSIFNLYKFRHEKKKREKKEDERHHYVHRFPLFGLSPATWFDKRKWRVRMGDLPLRSSLSNREKT
jgi:hypothetical protein